jgi:hypothetical protein
MSSMDCTAGDCMTEPAAPGATTRLIPFPQTPEQRLRVAVRRLESALEEQATAMAGFRSAIGQLGSVVRGLEQRTLDYRRNLDGLAGEVAGASLAARRLEDTAASMHARG